MSYIEFGIIVLHIVLWLTLFINYVESAFKLIRKPFEYYMTSVILFITMSISYPQSIYYYVGSIVVMLLTLLFVVLRKHNIEKIEKEGVEIIKKLLNELKSNNKEKDEEL